MKVLAVLSLLLAIASAVQLRPLTDISGATTTITVTSENPDSGVAPTLASVTYPTTYSSATPTVQTFSIVGNGVYIGNNSVATTGSFVTFTNGNDVTIVPVTVSLGAAGAFSFVSSQNPVFRNTADYTASVTLATNLLGLYTVTPTTPLLTVAATAYVPQTFTSLNVVSPQDGGCDATSCVIGSHLNATASLSPTTRLNTNLNLYFKPTDVAANGAFFVTTAPAVDGVVDFALGPTPMSAQWGGFINGQFVAKGVTTPAVTVLPTGTYAISASISETAPRVTWYNNAGQASVVFNAGGTDTAAPSCSVLSVTPATLTTINDVESGTLGLTCTDGAGSGVAASGVFADITITSGQQSTQTIAMTATGGTADIDVPPYVTGSFRVVGVWAIDNAGNAVVYGSCGNVQGYSTFGCGSSSASSVAVSLFAVVFLVIAALFA